MFEWGVFLLGRLHICSCLLPQPWRDSLRSPPKSIKFMRGVSCSHRKIEIEVRRGQTRCPGLSGWISMKARIIFWGTVKVQKFGTTFIHPFITCAEAHSRFPDRAKKSDLRWCACLALTRTRPCRTAGRRTTVWNTSRPRLSCTVVNRFPDLVCIDDWGVQFHAWYVSVQWKILFRPHLYLCLSEVRSPWFLPVVLLIPWVHRVPHRKKPWS